LVKLWWFCFCLFFSPYEDFRYGKELVIISLNYRFILFTLLIYVSSLNIGNEDFLKLAVEDFNICQSIHREELSQLARCISLSTFNYHDIVMGFFLEFSIIAGSMLAHAT
jgi:hypothetical protein